MKFNIKYLTLPFSIIVCISGNYINAMDLQEKEEISTNNNNINEIVINNNKNLNSINQNNINNDNNKLIISDKEKEIYSHLFEKNYQKEQYDKLCTACIESINSTKPEYVKLMQNTEILFNNLIEEIESFTYYKKFESEEENIEDFEEEEFENKEDDIDFKDKLKSKKLELPKMDISHIIDIL